MNRLQKKCLVTTTGFHLLLVVILIVGPGFFTSKPKVTDTVTLSVISLNTTEQQTTGVAKPTPPPPDPKPQPPTPVTPVTPPPTPQPPPTPEPVKPVVQPPDPVTPDLTPGELTQIKPKPLKKPKPKVDDTKDLLTHKVIKNISPHPADDTAEEDAKAAKAEQRRLRNLAQAFNRATHNIERNATSATQVEISGTSSTSFANYAQTVQSLYDRAWTDPESASSDVDDTIVRVVIASDGTVVSAHIITPSGDTTVDTSVQRALDHVPFIAPFPEGSTERQKTFTIHFNLKSKRQTG